MVGDVRVDIVNVVGDVEVDFVNAVVDVGVGVDVDTVKVVLDDIVEVCEVPVVNVVGVDKVAVEWVGTIVDDVVKLSVVDCVSVDCVVVVDGEVVDSDVVLPVDACTFGVVIVTVLSMGVEDLVVTVPLLAEESDEAISLTVDVCTVVCPGWVVVDFIVENVVDSVLVYCNVIVFSVVLPSVVNFVSVCEFVNTEMIQ